jgi:hypothetical protein
MSQAVEDRGCGRLAWKLPNVTGDDAEALTVQAATEMRPAATRTGSD